MVTLTFDVQPFVSWITNEYLPSVRVGRGQADYARRPGESVPALYGVADAACVQYTVGPFPDSTTDRQAWIDALSIYQEPRSGYFIADTSSLAKAHNTGFVVGALNLFDPDLVQGVLPRHRFGFADLIADEEDATRFADSLNWRGDCYGSGEVLIGLASSMYNVSSVVPQTWFDWLVQYIESGKLDAANGMVGVGKPAGGDLDQVGGTFHFDFFWYSLGRTLPHATQRTEALIGLQLDSGIWDANNPWWLTFDSIYMLARAIPELSETLADAARRSIERAVAVVAERASDAGQRSVDFEEPWIGLHMLLGAISLFANAQQTLGADVVKTDVPLNLVLDRRPYI